MLSKRPTPANAPVGLQCKYRDTPSEIVGHHQIAAACVQAHVTGVTATTRLLVYKCQFRDGGIDDVLAHEGSWSRVAGVNTFAIRSDDEVSRRHRLLEKHSLCQPSSISIEVRQRERDMRPLSVRADIYKHILGYGRSGKSNQKNS